jgi:methylase of polypeptide subunit release factors
MVLPQEHSQKQNNEFSKNGREFIYSLGWRRSISETLSKRFGVDRLIVFDDVAFAVPEAQRPKLHALPGYERILLPALMLGMEFSGGSAVIVTAPPNIIEMNYTADAKKTLEERVGHDIGYQIMWQNPKTGELIDLFNLYYRSKEQYLKLSLEYADWLNEEKNRASYSPEAHLEIFESNLDQITGGKETLVLPFQMTKYHQERFEGLNQKLGGQRLRYPSVPNMDKLRNNLLLSEVRFTNIPYMVGITPDGSRIETLSQLRITEGLGDRLVSNEVSLNKWAEALVSVLDDFFKKGIRPYLKLDSNGVSGLGNLTQSKYPWLYSPEVSFQDKTANLVEILSSVYPEGAILPAFSVVEEFVVAEKIGGVKYDATVGGLLIDGKFYPMSIFPFGVNENDEYVCGWMSPGAADLGESEEVWKKMIDAFSRMGEIMAQHGYSNGVLAGDVLLDLQGNLRVHDFNFRRGGRSYFEALVALEQNPYFECQVEIELPEKLLGLDNRQLTMLYTSLAAKLNEDFGIIPFSTSFGYFGKDHLPNNPDFFKFKLAVPLNLLLGERSGHYNQVLELVKKEFENLSRQLRRYNLEGQTVPNGEILLYIDDTVWPPYSAFTLYEDAKKRLEEMGKEGKDGELSILDIGTGTGILPILMQKSLPNCSVVVTDLNPSAVETAYINWMMNGGNPEKFHSVTGDGLSEEVVSKIQQHTNEGVGVVVANLPQQPLIDDLDGLATLRMSNPALWNIDPTRDPDGLGIFKAVVGNIHKVTKKGSLAFFSAASKQNFQRAREILDNLINEGKIESWEIIGERVFPVPDSYDRRLITHWLEREKQDGIKRIFTAEEVKSQFRIKVPDGKYYYVHYNILLKR